MVRRLATVLLCALALTGCGDGGVDKFVDDASDKAEEIRDRGREIYERERDRLIRRFEEILDELEKVVPEADELTQPPDTRGRDSASEIDAFLSDVLADVDEYWKTTLAAAGQPAPSVQAAFVSPGEEVGSACDAVADEQAAFYCPSDDTIYIGQSFAATLYDDLAGAGTGDFGVAYVVAHEYAHNIQTELGFFEFDQGEGVKPFELQADCMAGLWGNSVFRRGLLEPGDVEEAMSTALAVGDFAVGDAQHHGTPDERRDAWLKGYRSGDPSACTDYVPGTGG